jgi:hypothetical protein
MDNYDHQTYQGVESPDALIHYADEADEHCIIILDGARVCLIDLDGVEAHFVLGDNLFA